MNLPRNVHRTVLSVQGVQRVILEAEEKYGADSPFNSILKLYLMAKKARECIKDQSLDPTTGMEWVFNSVMDWVTAGLLETREIAVRTIKGEASGGRSFVDLSIIKLCLKGYLLDTYLNGLGIPADAKTKMRKHFQTHASFRQAFGYPNDLSGSVDLTWQSAWSRGTVGVCDLIKAPATVSLEPRVKVKDCRSGVQD